MPAQSFGFSPSLNESEICYILIADRSSEPLQDWTNGNEWKMRIDNETNDYASIRLIKVVGEMQPAKKTDKKISGDRSIPVKVERNISFTIDDTNTTNYDLARRAGIRNGLKVIAWYVTVGGRLFGGNSGIKALLSIEPAFGKGRNEMEVYAGSLTWNKYILPDMTVSPIVVCGTDLYLTDSNGALVVDDEGHPIVINNGKI